MDEIVREPTPPPPAQCGDGNCEASEDRASCCRDCPVPNSCCGNCICDVTLGETETSCNHDCGYCGDGIPYAGSCPGVREIQDQTDPDYPAFGCCEDFAVTCHGGGVQDQCCTSRSGGLPVGADAACPQDCLGTGSCDDGYCNPTSEGSASCCRDCHGTPECGDGVCCSADSPGGGGTETKTNCPADCCPPGGVREIDPSDGTPFCHLYAAFCPSGWQQFRNWTATISRTGCSSGPCVTSRCCTTGSHSWSNTPREQCTHPEICNEHRGVCGSCIGTTYRYAIVTEIGCVASP